MTMLTNLMRILVYLRASVSCSLGVGSKHTKQVRELVWVGIPSRLRSIFWPRAVGNVLNLSEGAPPMRARAPLVLRCTTPHLLVLV